MTDEEISELVARAEREHFKIWLYRLSCGHAIRTMRMHYLDRQLPCPYAPCAGNEQLIDYRITPQSESRHWPNWRQA